jgi:F0F1-type ATP synthase membrane subunit b/b'
MDNDEVLGHLLKIESEAAALVNDAQAEADKRVLEAEKQNHAAYEERYRKEGERLGNEFQALKEKIRRQYQTELESYSNKITSLHIDVNRFSALLDRFVTEEA